MSNMKIKIINLDLIKTITICFILVSSSHCGHLISRQIVYIFALRSHIANYVSKNDSMDIVK